MLLLWTLFQVLVTVDIKAMSRRKLLKKLDDIVFMSWRQKCFRCPQIDEILLPVVVKQRRLLQHNIFTYFRSSSLGPKGAENRPRTLQCQEVHYAWIDMDVKND